ncbi:MAG: hypothetical protein JJ896_07155 [Rhodothermales bacterium]|nr:hypothetical protein [Rhodothermales bacterium]MBO6779415.1 hypothetical protein [Rhodothermales bacterium]
MAFCATVALALAACTPSTQLDMESSSLPDDMLGSYVEDLDTACRQYLRMFSVYRRGDDSFGVHEIISQAGRLWAGQTYTWPAGSIVAGRDSGWTYLSSRGKILSSISRQPYGFAFHTPDGLWTNRRLYPETGLTETELPRDAWLDWTGSWFVVSGFDAKGSETQINSDSELKLGPGAAFTLLRREAQRNVIWQDSVTALVSEGSVHELRLRDGDVYRLACPTVVAGKLTFSLAPTVSSAASRLRDAFELEDTTSSLRLVWKNSGGLPLGAR